MEQFPDISTRLVKFEGALALLKKPKKEIEHIKFQKHMSLDKLYSTCDKMKIVDEIYALNEERKNIGENSKVIDEALTTATLFDGIDIDFEKLKSNALGFRVLLSIN